jgi:DNA-binding beta-propeller fold protein YncE
MCYAKRVAILMVVLSAVASAGGPPRVGAWAEPTVASSANTLNAIGTSDDGEVWVTAQDADELKILLGMGSVETVALPVGSQPHTITFSPDGSYAYVANLGNGDLIVVRSEDRQIVATLDLGATFTHHAKATPNGSVVLSANPVTGILTKIAADEESETWTPVASLDVFAVTGQGPVCVTYRADGARAYISLFGSAGGIAIVDVETMTVLDTRPTVGSVSGCGTANSNDGRTIFLDSSGGTGHFYRLDTTTDTLTEDTGFGPIGMNLHGLVTTPNEKYAYIAAIGTDEVKVLDLNGTQVRTISLDVRPGIRDAPEDMARRGSNIYVTVRFAGQVARIKTQTGTVEYINLVPPVTPSNTRYPVHGIAVRP